MATTNPEKADPKIKSAQEEAAKDAKTVHDTLQKKTSREAYQAMWDEIDHARSEFKGNDKALAAYRSSMAKELQKNGDVDELSKVWLSRAFGKVDITNQTGTAENKVNANKLAAYASDDGIAKYDDLTKTFARGAQKNVGSGDVTFEQVNTQVDTSDAQRRQNIVESQNQNLAAGLTDTLKNHRAGNGQTLLEAAAATDFQHPGKKEVTKDDIGNLLQLAKNGLVKVDAKDLQTLNDIYSGWDSKPEIQKLHQVKNADGTVTDAKAITDASIKFASGEQAKEEQVAAGKQVDANRAKSNETLALLRDHLTEDGRTIFKAAAEAGGNPDAKAISKDDLQKLSDLADQKLVKLDPEDNKKLKELLKDDVWNSDAIKPLRDGDKITADKLKPESQKQSNPSVPAPDTEALKTRKAASELLAQLKEYKSGDYDLITAADRAGAYEARNGIRIPGVSKWEDGIDQKEFKKDFEALLKSGSLAKGSKQYELVKRVVDGWDTDPAVKALRGGGEYITNDTQANLS
jgi:hypothetical protein